MGNSGAIIGGLLKGFVSGFGEGDGEDFETIFQQNEIRKQKINKEKERLKDRSRGIEVGQGIATIMRDSVPGKERKGRFDRLGAGTGTPAYGEYLSNLSPAELDKHIEGAKLLQGAFPNLGALELEFTAKQGPEAFSQLFAKARKVISDRAEKKLEEQRADRGLGIAGEDRRPQITEQNIPQTETARAGAFQRRFGAQVQRAQRTLDELENQRNEIFRGRGGQAARTGIESRINDAREDLKDAKKRADKHKDVKRSRIVFEAKRNKAGEITGLRAIEIGRNAEGKVIVRDDLGLDIPASQAQIIGDLMSGQPGEAGQQGGISQETEDLLNEARR